MRRFLKLTAQVKNQKASFDPLSALRLAWMEEIRNSTFASPISREVAHMETVSLVNWRSGESRNKGGKGMVTTELRTWVARSGAHTRLLN